MTGQFSHTQGPHVFHIVYSLCGSNRKEELLRSIGSLIMLTKATAVGKNPSATYHIHVITDGGIPLQGFPYVNGTGLCYHLHKPNQNAAPLFAPCSTQRLYLHEHEDFLNIRQVRNSISAAFMLDCIIDLGWSCYLCQGSSSKNEGPHISMRHMLENPQ